MLRMKSENLENFVLEDKNLNVVVNTSMLFNTMLKSTTKEKKPQWEYHHFLHLILSWNILFDLGDLFGETRLS